MTFGKHFSIWDWVDFVRDAGRTAKFSQMSDHLASGCRRCERLVRVLGDFARRATLEPGNEPPAHVIRLAEAIYPTRRAEHTIIGRLVYDSFRQPVPAGMRASGQLARHALFQAGDVFVDLQMEQRHAGAVTLVGQISDREARRPDMPPLPVLLTSARGLVTSTLCNALGEFELTYEPRRRLRLHVPLRDTGSHLELRMDELAPAAFTPIGGPSTGPGRRRSR